MIIYYAHCDMLSKRQLDVEVVREERSCLNMLERVSFDSSTVLLLRNAKDNNIICKGLCAVLERREHFRNETIRVCLPLWSGRRVLNMMMPAENLVVYQNQTGCGTLKYECQTAPYTTQSKEDKNKKLATSYTALYAPLMRVCRDLLHCHPFG